MRIAGAAAGDAAGADVVLVNTCSVTAEADREARAYIRRVHRLNPAARVVATGCYAQRAPEELAAIPGVAAVVGNSHKALVPAIALKLTNTSPNQPTCGGARPVNILVPASIQDLPVSGHDFGRAVKVHQNSGALAPEEVSTPPQFVTIPSLLASLTHPLILADDTFAHSFLAEAPIVAGAQTRPNLKIQEGCSNRCSFCVIPQTRGSSRSLPAATVLNRVRSFVQSGGNELVLSGINLGRWGRDIDPALSAIRTFSALVRTILEQTKLPRLRLSSIEPMDWDADLIALMREFGGTRLARHAHLPLQSSSDAVLRRMHRRYRPWHYAEKVAALIGATGPALTLGADVMVGFPGETEREFRETYDFISALPFGYLHLFPFSPRPGTRAWTLHAESPVPPSVVDERITEMRALASAKLRAHRAQFVGVELDAITLNNLPAPRSTGRTSALTENFLPVDIDSALPANQLIRIRVTGLSTDNVLLASTGLSVTSASTVQSGQPRHVRALVS